MPPASSHIQAQVAAVTPAARQHIGA
jgi:hypothetical protein